MADLNKVIKLLDNDIKNCENQVTTALAALDKAKHDLDEISEVISKVNKELKTYG